MQAKSWPLFVEHTLHKISIISKWMRLAWYMNQTWHCNQFHVKLQPPFLTHNPYHIVTDLGLKLHLRLQSADILSVGVETLPYKQH